MMARKTLSSSDGRRRCRCSALTCGLLSAAVVFLSCLLQLCPLVEGLSVDAATAAFVATSRCHQTSYCEGTMPSTNSVMTMRRQSAEHVGLMSRSSSSNDRRRLLVLCSIASNDGATTSTSSSTSATTTAHSIRMEEQINSGLERAKLILEKSKAKLAAREQGADASIAIPIAASVTVASDELGNDVAAEMMNDLPFFAQLQVVSASPSSVSDQAPVASTRESNLVKTRNDETGLFTIDGEKMAAQSEQEEWEYRSLSQVFSTTATAEMDDDERIPSSSSASSSSLADRDVLASIYNLRMQLQQDDYQRIFDTRNRFIGEDN